MLTEVCNHAVQLHGLCALCGSDVSQLETATINIAHDARGITLSEEVIYFTIYSKEAQRVEMETKDRLLKEKRLSLILDLDQTVIHATVDLKVKQLIKDPSSKMEDIYSFTLPCSPMEYHIKLR